MIISATVIGECFDVCNGKMAKNCLDKENYNRFIRVCMLANEGKSKKNCRERLLFNLTVDKSMPKQLKKYFIHNDTKRFKCN